MFPRVFVILPVHNRRELTLRFVSHLRRQDYSPVELVLVDDGSTDGTAQAVRELYPSTKVIQGNGNLWWGGAIFSGLKFIEQMRPTSTDLILLINDDTEIPEYFVSTGVEFLKEHSDCFLLAQSKDITGLKILESGSQIQWPFFRIKKAENEGDINCAPSRGLMFSLETYQAVGPWIPEILPHYCSDYEFTCRAVRKGFKIKMTSKFWLKTNPETTGMEFVRAKNTPEYFKQVFSQKSIRNPITVSKFILLACPWYFQPTAILKVWLGFAYRYLQFLLKIRIHTESIS